MNTRRIARPAETVSLHALALVAALLSLFPLVWMLSVSLMPDAETQRFPPALIPEAPTLSHYRELFRHIGLGRQFANSLAIALTTTLISLALNTLAGYAFAKLRWPGRERLFRLLLLALVVPGQVGMLPLFLLLKQLGLVNTYAGVLVPGLASLFGIFLVRQYALSIPDSVLDAARIDGASEWRVFRSVALPLCRPILATLAVFTFLGSWNDFMWPLVILGDDRLATLPVALANLLGEHVQDNGLMMAGAVLTIAPTITLFLLLQRHYLAGIGAGALKE